MLGILQHGFRQRDPRHKVLLPSRMRTGSSWSNVCIHNVSTRGLLVAADAAPSPGDYVEIRRGPTVIIGRAVWRRDRFFGVRTQDRVDLAALRQPSGRRAPPGDAPAERRGGDRLSRDIATARSLERHRQLSRLFQFGLAAAAAVAASAVMADSVYDVLAAPMERARHSMEPHP